MGITEDPKGEALGGESSVTCSTAMDWIERWRLWVDFVGTVLGEDRCLLSLSNV